METNFKLARTIGNAPISLGFQASANLSQLCPEISTQIITGTMNRYLIHIDMKMVPTPGSAPGSSALQAGAFTRLAWSGKWYSRRESNPLFFTFEA